MLITDAVCLKSIVKERLLAGIGNELSFYHVSADSETIRTPCPVKSRDKLHGIDALVNDKESLVVFAANAGRELILGRIVQNVFSSCFVVKLSDWISSVKFNTEDSLTVLTAHNVAVHLRIGESEAKIDGKCRNSDTSTLYCSKIIGDEWTSTIILSGTALGEIVVWKVVEEATIGHDLIRFSAHNGVIFSIDLKNNLLISTSDDRSVKFWRVDKGFGFSEQRSCFGHTSRVFRGKIIEESFVATAGEDSNLCLWDLSGKLLLKKNFADDGTIWGLDYDPTSKTIFLSGSSGIIRKFSVEKQLKGEKEQMPEYFLAENEFPQKITFTKCGILIGCSNRNRLFWKSDQINFLELPTNDKISLLEAIEDQIYVACTNSIVHMYKMDSHSKSIVFEKSQKIQNFAFIRALFSIGDNRVVICDTNGRLCVADRYLKVIQSEFLLPKCNERWICSALEVRNYLLVSDRSGNLLLFCHGKPDSICSLRHLNGNLGIPSIQLQEMTENVAIVNIFGHNSIKTIEFDIEKESLRVVFTKLVPINFLEKQEGRYLFGFNDNHFMVCHREDGDIKFKMPCGGRHRFWDVFVDENWCNFAFIHEKRVKIVRFELENRPKNRLKLPILNFHTNNCNVSQLIEENVLISGGENNVLKFSRLQNDSLEQICDSHQHISSIKAIVVHKLPQQKQFLVISGGGRAQICLTRIVLEPKLKITEEFSFMMLSSDDRRRREGKSQTIFYDPETRFLSMTLVGQSRLFVACSDGFIREFQLEMGSKFAIYGPKMEKFYGKCLLNVASLSKNDQNFLISMATDGLIVFWAIQDTDLVLINQIRHHESGVNCFDLLQNGDQLFLATGGDDQKVVLSTLEFDTFAALKRVKADLAHTAQVTGVKFATDGVLVTVGVDQMVNELDVVDLSVKRSTFSSIADAKGIVLSGNQALVYGWGLQRLEILNKR